MVAVGDADRDPVHGTIDPTSERMSENRYAYKVDMIAHEWCNANGQNNRIEWNRDAFARSPRASVGHLTFLAFPRRLARD